MISRVERPGLLAVADSTSMQAEGAAMINGTVRERHGMRVEQQYAAAQYQAQQQFAQHQRTFSADGSRPPIRNHVPGRTNEAVVADVRKLLALHANGTLTDAHFAEAVAKLLA